MFWILNRNQEIQERSEINEKTNKNKKKREEKGVVRKERKECNLKLLHRTEKYLFRGKQFHCEENIYFTLESFYDK